MAPSNHSRQSARNTSPGLTLTTAGISGCHRLCPTCFWSVNFLVLSSGNRFWGIPTPWLEDQRNRVSPERRGSRGHVRRPHVKGRCGDDTSASIQRDRQHGVKVPKQGTAAVLEEPSVLRVGCDVAGLRREGAPWGGILLERPMYPARAATCAW